MPSGSGDGYGYGDGYGSGDGDGYGSGSGSGSGYGDGDGDGDSLPDCGGHSVSVVRTFGVLRIGCEVHTLADWIERADEIDAKHGDGIAEQTRSLARSLMGSP